MAQLLNAVRHLLRFIRKSCFCKDTGVCLNTDIVGNNNKVSQTFNVGVCNSVFMPMSRFLETFNTQGFSYIPFPKFETVKKQILNEQYQLIQFLGLSGIGKSRMVFEIFKDTDNTHNFYCQNASDERLINELSSLLRESKDERGIIVLDNCNATIFSEVCRLRMETYSFYKIIGIYNDPEAVVRQNGVNQLFLNRSDLVDTVNQYVEDQMGMLGVNSENIVQQIQSVSDGFPVVALKAIQSYRENGVASLMNEDELWKRMCGYQVIDEDKRMALQSLSLFDPLGYKQEFAADYKFVKYNKSITPFEGYSQQKIDDIFDKLIDSYTQKELIERNSCWLLVRPLPLAVWLVGQWFSNCGQSRLARVLNDLDAIQDLGQARRMKRALCKRIQNMQDNERAMGLLGKLVSVGAPFHNEEVVSSNFGSQLFLAISTVNPTATTDCLYDIIMPKSLDWAKEVIKDDIRRNYIWCMERLCMPKDTFHKSAMLLAKFSVAENESWGNNATGQFLQLFHVALSGTEATLKQRLEVMEELRTMGDDYLPMVIKSIDSAFCYSSFHRNAGHEHIGGRILKDFDPTGLDIYEYWKGCIKIVGELLHSYAEYVNQIADVVVKHIDDLAWRSGCYDLLEQLISMVVDIRGNVWPEMHKELLHLKGLARLTQDKKDIIDKWIKLFGANDFLLALDETHTLFYSENKEQNFHEKMAHAAEYFTPIAKRFKNESLYTDSAIVSQLLDSQTNEIGFIKALSKVLSIQQTRTFLKVIAKCLDNKSADFQSDFLNLFYFSLSSQEIKDKFLISMLHQKKYMQYIVLKASDETEDLSVLKELLRLVDAEQLPGRVYLRQYLYRMPMDTSERIFKTCAYILNNIDEGNDIVLDYIVAHEFLDVILESPMNDLTKKLLLTYDSKKSTIKAHGINSIVKRILKSNEDSKFAVAYNKKLLKEIDDYDSFRLNEHIYFILLPKYQEYILNDILKEIAKKDSDFWYYGGKDLGSGQGFGAGPLFQCDIEAIKNYCLKESQGCLPYRLAYLAPVFDYTDNNSPSFSEFFYWLMENFEEFKEQEKILSEFGCNMGSYSWGGSIIPLLEKKLACFEKLKRNTNPIIKKWIDNHLTSLTEQLRREQNLENYMKLC